MRIGSVLVAALALALWASAAACQTAKPEAGAKRMPDTPATSPKRAERAETKPSPSPSSPVRGAEPAVVTGGAGAPPPVPATDVLTMLVRTTLVALAQANYTGNYTVLHGLCTPAMQAASSPADLAIAFTALRRQAVDLTPSLALAPVYAAPAGMSPQGVLTVAGAFPSQPYQIAFEMAFQPVNGHWRIDGLKVSAVASPASADPPGAPQPTAARPSAPPG
jgi:hypothetical protein